MLARALQIVISRSRPHVTFIMPVRNGMPFLAQTLASIAEQTYAPHQLIVWDNGSTDGTQDELRRWIPDRIRGELVLDRPLPLGRSRAALVERAETELVACIDADDLNRPTRVERQVERMLQSPDLVALGTVPDIIDDTEHPLPDWIYPLEDAEIRWRTLWHTSLNASAVMFRRSAVLAAGNYRDVPSEDLDLWIRLARLGRMENLKERLVLYRRHPANLTAGITDFFTTDRQVAGFNAADIFPGLGAIHSLELWEAAYPHYGEVVVRPRHLKLLESTAVRAARRCGEADAYFTSTRFYALQRMFMRRNIVTSMFGVPSATMKRIHAFRTRLRLRS